MSLEDTIDLIKEAGTNKEKIAILKGALSAIDDPKEKERVEILLLDVLINSDLASEKILILIHGIRTHAVWQDKIKNEFKDDPDVIPYPIGYGDFFHIISFAMAYFTQRKQQKKILQEIRSIKNQHPLGEYIVIAHSFGTYLLSRILKTNPDIVFNGLILCGSIVRTDFAWDNLANLPKNKIINDVGTKDIQPVLAKLLSRRYGTSGSFGFKTNKIEDRYHNFGHSDFFDQAFIRKFWRPYIANDYIIENSDWSADRETPSWLISMLPKIPISLLFLSIPLLYIYYEPGSFGNIIGYLRNLFSH